MPLQNYLYLALVFFAFLISTGSGVYLVFRYRTRLAFWCGLILLSQALELACYFLQLADPAAFSIPLLFFMQIVFYTSLSVFWLLFVFAFAQVPRRIRFRIMAPVLCLPAVYLLTMAARLGRGLPALSPDPAHLGSLMRPSRLISGTPAISFFIFGYGIALVSIVLLLRFYSRSNPLTRKLILPLLSGPVVLIGGGILEQADFHFLGTVSVHHLAVIAISFLAFWIVYGLRLGSVLSSGLELAIDQMQDAVLILDRQDRVVDLNLAAQRILGWAGKTSLKQPLAKVWPDGAGLTSGQEASDRSGRKASFQVDGEETAFNVDISALEDAYHNPAGRLIVLRNATGRERMLMKISERSRELQRTNGFLAALAEVNLKIQSATDPPQIYAALGGAFKKMGLTCFIARLDPDTGDLSLTYLAASPEEIGRIEKILGLEVAGFRLDKERFSALYDIVKSNETGFSRYHPEETPEGPGKRSGVRIEHAIRVLGLDPGIPTLMLPLATGTRPLGLMGVWGSDLRESDIAPFRIFASQAALVIERAILYETEIRRSTDLARANNLIVALSNVALQLGTTSKAELVLETLGRELRKVGMNCAVVSIDPGGEMAFLQYLSFKPELIRLIERLIGFKTENLEIPKSTWPGDRIVTEKVPVWYPHPREVFRRMFPRIPAVLAKQAFRLLNFGDDDQLCFLPLISEERTIGALPIWGADVKPSDNPILSVFANQVATAMNNARLFDLAQKEIAERTQAEAQIRKALNEKEVLLKEVNHRVKNNLQVISSLLNLQKAQTRDVHSIDSLQECQNRVRVMALIHEKLYQSDNLAQVDFLSYLRSLTDHLVRTYPVNSRTASIEVRSEEITLDLDTAIPCGLIVNELVSNSLKYAFPDGPVGRIQVSCSAGQDGHYSLIVGDDGVGLPAGLDVENCPSLGLKLVSLLVRQINGDLKVAGAPGARFEIRFPKSTSSKSAAGPF